MRRERDILLSTSSTPIVTLFSHHIDSSRHPASLLASGLLHVLVGGLVFFGIITAPAPVKVDSAHYTVRHLDLRAPDPQRAAKGSTSAAAREVAKALTAAGAPSAALQQSIHAAAGPQTLLQPDLPVQTAAAQEIPVPRVLIWTPRKEVVKNIVAPQPAPPTIADTRPSLDAPNISINLSDLAMAASDTHTPKLPVPAGSTTPVVSLAASQVQLAPSSTSQQTIEPTPTAVLSLSDLAMKDGPVTLPPVNETARASNNGTLFGASETALNGQGVDGNRNGNGSGNLGTGSAGPAGDRNGASTAQGQGTPSGNGAFPQPTATQITLPRDGRFGAVVVGQSVNEQFPEMAEVWSGRLAYTVYLHVGLARSWILQYSLPRDDDAAAAGSANRLDAPWPYNIVRPNLGPTDVNADALMIHGFVDQAGHFQDLSMVFPLKCAQAPFVLKSLEQWQFRPASQNGQVAKVEVLLIIPEDLE